MAKTCEACEGTSSPTKKRRVEDVSVTLCDRCVIRLRRHALSPRQWYVLARRYGIDWYPLCDDFYDDHGIALQPDLAIDDTVTDPIPDFDSIRQDREELIDWCVTRWKLSEPEIIALKAIGHVELLASLNARLERSASLFVDSRLLEVVGKVGDDRFADFVREAWSVGTRRYALHALAEASAVALPEEGRLHVEAALAEMSPKERYLSMACLGYFRAPAVLDWIERNCGEPLMESWGNLAALCRPDWNRISKWLDSGRPLSLVALDTLLALVDPRTPLLYAANAVLEDPPTREELHSRLESYGDRDPVPRVQQRVDWLIRKPGPIFSEHSPRKA